MCRTRIRSQQELNRTRREEAESLKQEAKHCRAQADSCAILGSTQMQLGCKSQGRPLLEEGIEHDNYNMTIVVSMSIAEKKQNEAMRRSREAEDNEKMVTEGERNVHRLLDHMLANGRQR